MGEASTWYLYSQSAAEQIKRYFNLFSRDQIFISTHDDLKQDCISLLQSIFDFLEVDNNFVPNISIRHNQTKLPKNQIINQFLTKSSHWKEIAKFLMPNFIRNNLRNKVVQINHASVSKLSQKVKKKYILLYQEDILKTSELINLDVSQWLNS